MLKHCSLSRISCCKEQKINLWLAHISSENPRLRNSMLTRCCPLGNSGTMGLKYILEWLLL